MSRILVVSAHPDDETLGCGGTLLKHAAAGDELFWVNVTEMRAADGWPDERIKSREQEIQKVVAAYGFKKDIHLGFPTARLDTLPSGDLVGAMSAAVREIDPETVLVMNRSDVHSDHRIVFDTVMSSTKHFRFPGVKQILMYETLSETEFAPALPDAAFCPNVFVDVSAHFARKLEIMRIYASEVMDAPGPRSLSAMEALARFRGSRIGADFAEAFSLLFSRDVL